MKRRFNPMKIAMEVCSIRHLSVSACHLSGIIHSIKENGVTGVGLTKDKYGHPIEYIEYSDGYVCAGKDTLSDILSEEGSEMGQDMFDSINEMQSKYSA